MGDVRLQETACEFCRWWNRIMGATGLDAPVPAEHTCLGYHLRESAAQVRSWPAEDQRSQGIRGEAPPRHG